MSDQALVSSAAAVALVGLMAYAVFGGADFGGGVWDLFASGPRRHRQREAIADAMGPVWEANHVWLIFVLVVLFTCFPSGYAKLAVALFVPFHLALLGIMLRGAAFVFRNVRKKSAVATGATATAAADNHSLPLQVSAWGVVFGTASVVSPLILGCAFGAVTAGDIGLESAPTTVVPAVRWLTPYSIGCGLLAICACAYLAAVYLTAETDGALRDDFRRRAILAGTVTAGMAAVVLVLARWQAPWFFERLISRTATPVIAAGLFCFAASAWAVYSRRYHASRVFAAGEIVLLLLGWGIAQQPYLAYPQITLMEAAAPRATIQFLLFTLPFGFAILAPSLWYLMRVFKTARKQEAAGH